MDMNVVEIAFNVPYQYPRYRTKPTGFLAHMIGHEGPGSIHSYLKKKSWLVSLEAGSSPLGRGFDCFRITLTLTPKGLRKSHLIIRTSMTDKHSENWEDILVATYKYISMLKASTLQQFHHAEIRSLSEIRYRFKEKRKPEEYVATLSDLLQRPYTRENLLSASMKVWDWDEGEIRDTLNMLSVNTGRVMVMAKNLDDVSPNVPWVKEKWYETEYKLQRLPEEITKKAAALNDIPEFFVPAPNPFIPSNLHVEKVSVPEVRFQD
jgi:insulysin